MDTTANGALRETFVLGLKNAHAVEKEALSIMSPQIERLQNYPEMADRLRLHSAETERQIERLETILHDLSEDYSAFKDMTASLGGSMAALGHSIAGDEVLKNSLANFAFENYEIAAYRSLLTLAEAGSFKGAEGLLRQTLSEEEDMAAWIEANLPATTLRYVELSAAGATAKR